MADTTEREVLLNVHANTEDALNNIVKLRKANEELRQSLTNDRNALADMQKAAQDAGGATSEQAAQMDALRKNMETTAQQIKANTAAINGNLKAVDLSIAKAEQAEGSLLALRKEAAALTQRYQELSREEREGAKGQELQKHIKDVNDEVREATLSIGNFKDNIGNYQSALTGVITDTTGFGKALKTLGVDLNATGSGMAGLKNGFAMAGAGALDLGKAFTALAANPFIAIISVVTGLILACKKAIQDNAEASAAWSYVLKSLEPIFALLGKAVAAVGNLVVSIVGKITDALGTVAKGVAKVVDFFGGLVGAEVNAEKALTRYQEAAKKSAELANEIAEKEMKIGRDTAETAMEVAELRVKAEDKVNYSVKQRLAFLDEAIKKEQEIADRRTELAALKVKQAQEQLAMDAQSLSKQKELADAEQAYFEAQKDRGEKYRELQAQRITFLDEERNALAAIKAQAEAAAKSVEEQAAKFRELQQAEAAASAEMLKSAKSLELANDLRAIEAAIEATKRKWEEERKGRAASLEEVATYNAALAELENRRFETLQAQEQLRYDEELERNAATIADTEAQLAYEEELQRQHALNLEQIKEESRQRQRDAEAAYAEEQQTKQYQDYGSLASLYQQYEDAKTQYGEQSEQARAALMSLEAGAAKEAFGSLGNALMEFQGENKAAFEAGKAISIATATVDTYESAQKSFNAMADIPIVGPALGAVAAAAAVASGIVRVKKIKDTKFNSGSTPSASAGGSSSSASSSSSAAATSATTSQVGGSAYYDYAGLDTGASAAGRAVQSSAADSDRMTREDMVAAIEAQPAPVVSVKDINEGQEARKVKVSSQTY